MAGWACRKCRVVKTYRRPPANECAGCRPSARGAHNSKQLAVPSAGAPQAHAALAGQPAAAAAAPAREAVHQPVLDIAEIVAQPAAAMPASDSEPASASAAMPCSESWIDIASRPAGMGTRAGATRLAQRDMFGGPVCSLIVEAFQGQGAADPRLSQGQALSLAATATRFWEKSACMGTTSAHGHQRIAAACIILAAEFEGVRKDEFARALLRAGVLQKHELAAAKAMVLMKLGRTK